MTDQRQYQRVYRKRLREQGLVEVIVWVPADQREKVKSIAAAMRANRSVTKEDRSGTNPYGQ